jgi:hypothetical protein
MKKPFSNAYDAIKKLFQKMFGKKDAEETVSEEQQAEGSEESKDEGILNRVLNQQRNLRNLSQKKIRKIWSTSKMFLQISLMKKV